MSSDDNEQVSGKGEIVLYQTADGATRVKCRFEEESIWLSQALIAELYDRDVRTINEHLQNIYAEDELDPSATIRKFRIVRTEGEREAARNVDHYNLDAILAVGYRVSGHRPERGQSLAFRLNVRKSRIEILHPTI